MANWKFHLPNTLRKNIEDDNGLEVLRTLKQYVETLNAEEIMDDQDYYDWIDDIENQIDNFYNYEDYDMTEEDVDDEINYIIDKFYDWCDYNRVFIEL